MKAVAETAPSLVEVSRVVHDCNLPAHGNDDPEDGVDQAHALVYVQRGSYRSVLDAGPTLDAGPGEGMVHPAGSRRRSATPRDGGATLLVMRWTGGWRPPASTAFADPGQRVAVQLRRLDELAELAPPDAGPHRQVLCAAVLHELRWLLAAAAGEESDDLALRVRRFLELNYRHLVDLDHLAARYGTSRATLCRRFRARWGTSPMAHLRRVRLDRALDLLSDPARTLDDIARDTGHRSAACLAQAVRRGTGRSPRAWRSLR